MNNEDSGSKKPDIDELRRAQEEFDAQQKAQKQEEAAKAQQQAADEQATKEQTPALLEREAALKKLREVYGEWSHPEAIQQDMEFTQRWLEGLEESRQVKTEELAVVQESVASAQQNLKAITEIIGERDEREIASKLREARDEANQQLSSAQAKLEDIQTELEQIEGGKQSELTGHVSQNISKIKELTAQINTISQNEAVIDALQVMANRENELFQEAEKIIDTKGAYEQRGVDPYSDRALQEVIRPARQEFSRHIARLFIEAEMRRRKTEEGTRYSDLPPQERLAKMKEVVDKITSAHQQGLRLDRTMEEMHYGQGGDAERAVRQENYRKALLLDIFKRLTGSSRDASESTLVDWMIRYASKNEDFREYIPVVNEIIAAQRMEIGQKKEEDAAVYSIYPQFGSFHNLDMHGENREKFSHLIRIDIPNGGFWHEAKQPGEPTITITDYYTKERVPRYEKKLGELNERREKIWQEEKDKLVDITSQIVKMGGFTDRNGRINEEELDRDLRNREREINSLRSEQDQNKPAIDEQIAQLEKQIRQREEAKKTPEKGLFGGLRTRNKNARLDIEIRGLTDHRDGLRRELTDLEKRIKTRTGERERLSALFDKYKKYRPFLKRFIQK